jgi:hypothetical protein
MKQLIATLAITAALLAFHSAAWANCTTNTVFQGGRAIVCSTCCVSGSCTTVCSP